MTEDTHRTWDIVFKWFGLVAVLASAYWTVHSYNQSRASELVQQQYTQKQDEQARTKDLNAFIFQHQATLYFDAARSAATLADALDPYSDNRTAIDAKTLKAERERFDQLYWGELVVVEDRRVEMAMIAFRECMLLDGKKCESPTKDQYSKDIDPAVLKKAGSPLLVNLALQLAACTRSALQKDREISFGAVEPANTVCPYDGQP
jgi:hypothetical protein